MDTKWKDMTPIQKVGFIITCIAGVLVVAVNLKPDLFPVNVTFPAIAVAGVGEAAACWKKERKWAYLLIAGSVICMACFLLELFLL